MNRVDASMLQAAAASLLLGFPGPTLADDSSIGKQTEERVGAISMFADADAKAKGQTVGIIKRPLLSFSDPARLNENGSLWAWGQSGRPLAFAEVYRHSDEQVRWAHAITLTSNSLVSAQVDALQWWTPQEVQVDFKPVANAPVPAAQHALRLRQMKDLARRFDAHEFWDPDNSRYELRLLVQPIWRYSDIGREILDGAVFVFAHGVNPEIILLLEAHGNDFGNARWKCAFAALGSAELRVQLDGDTVWHRERTPGVVGQPTDPYWLFFTRSDQPPLPEVSADQATQQ